MKEDSKITEPLTFNQGIKDGIPIFLGYLPIAVALGVAMSKFGVSFWMAQIIHLFVYTATGEKVMFNLLSGGETMVFAFVLTLFVVNCRYIFLSWSFAQRIDPKMNTFQRLLFGFFFSDEIFAMTTKKEGKLNASYLYGIAILPYFSWIIGGILGFLFTSILPPTISSAMGIIIYSLFIALVVPSVKKSKSTTIVVSIAALISVLLECIPTIRQYLSPSVIIIICAVVSSGIGAILYPVNKGDADNG